MDKLLSILEKNRKVSIPSPEGILIAFYENFKLNRDNIKSILISENELMNANYDYDKLLNKFKLLKDYGYEKNKNYSSIGTILCLTNGDPYFVLELIIKAILTRNKIVFANDVYMNNINSFLVELAKSALKEFKVDPNIIFVTNLRNYKNIAKLVNKIDCIVVNKNYGLYKELQELCDIKTIYLDYGNINVYSDSEEFEENIKELRELARKENKEVFIARTEDIQKYLEGMNNNFLFHSVVVYTKNAEKCAYFLKNIKAENIYINTNPFDNLESIISEYEFLYKKKIVY